MTWADRSYVKLAEAYAKVASVPKGPPCTIALFCEQLDDEDRKTLNALLADKDGVRHTDIVETLKEAQRMGAKLPPIPNVGVFSRHRRGLCRCESGS